MKRIFTHSCKMLLLLFFFNTADIHHAFAQQLNISGTITDSKHLPVPAASVQIKGTKSGTTADIGGKYTIKAAPGQVLVFKSIGFDAKEVTVGSSTIINVSLAETESQLNEVVVIGYGAQKRANVTGPWPPLKQIILTNVQ
jgi:hypothetical protein